MSMRAKLASSAALAAVALVAWRFLSPPGEPPLGNAPQSASETADATLPRLETAPTPAAPHPVVPGQDPLQSSPAASQRDGPDADPYALNERTLVGTKWEREGFGIEF